MGERKGKVSVCLSEVRSGSRHHQTEKISAQEFAVAPLMSSSALVSQEAETHPNLWQLHSLKQCKCLALCRNCSGIWSIWSENCKQSPWSGIWSHSKTRGNPIYCQNNILWLTNMVIFLCTLYLLESSIRVQGGWNKHTNAHTGDEGANRNMANLTCKQTGTDSFVNLNG